MARAGRPTRLRIQGRLRDRLSAGEGTRICRRDVQAYPPEGERRPFGRGSAGRAESRLLGDRLYRPVARAAEAAQDRKSTRLNSSHVAISYAVFCLKKKTY